MASLALRSAFQIPLAIFDIISETIQHPAADTSEGLNENYEIFEPSPSLSTTTSSCTNGKKSTRAKSYGSFVESVGNMKSLGNLKVNLTPLKTILPTPYHYTNPNTAPATVTMGASHSHPLISGEQLKDLPVDEPTILLQRARTLHNAAHEATRLLSVLQACRAEGDAHEEAFVWREVDQLRREAELPFDMRVLEAAEQDAPGRPAFASMTGTECGFTDDDDNFIVGNYTDVLVIPNILPLAERVEEVDINAAAIERIATGAEGDSEGWVAVVLLLIEEMEGIREWADRTRMFDLGDPTLPSRFPRPGR